MNRSKSKACSSHHAKMQCTLPARMHGKRLKCNLPVGIEKPVKGQAIHDARAPSPRHASMGPPWSAEA